MLAISIRWLSVWVRRELKESSNITRARSICRNWRSLLRALADGTLKHEDVFNDMGHGALMYSQEKFEFGKDDFDVVVTGPDDQCLVVNTCTARKCRCRKS